MKLIESKVEVIEQQPGLDGVYKQVELAGRTCYRSYDKITETSAKEFTERMIKSKHCYTGDSEVLTEDGWVRWKDYAGEKIAVVNSDTTFKGYEIPIRVIKHVYTGTFYEYPELGIKVTDGHKMFGMFRDSKHDFYHENLYDKFCCNTKYVDNNGNRKTLGERTFKTPTNCAKIITTDPFYELVGFWLGDGCVCKQTVNKLVFHLKKERKINYLKQLCEECGYLFEQGECNYYKVCSPNIGRLFNSQYFDTCKKIDEPLTPVQIHSVIQGLINSDGSLGKTTATITFTNTSKKLINWLLKNAVIGGYNITDCGIIKTTNADKDLYKVLLKASQYVINNDVRKPEKKVIISNDTLDVFCVTVSTGLIIVRGINGQTSICGNCAMLEHGTVYLKLEGINKSWEYYHAQEYLENNYSKVVIEREGIDGADWCEFYITTNLRVLVENNWLDDLQYICEPTEHHEKRITARFTCDRGVSHEIVRHRVMSFAQESTRYCNYGKDKFDNEVTFIKPTWYSIVSDEQKEAFDDFLSISEEAYMALLDKWENRTPDKRYKTKFKGNPLTPQQARQVLPNALKTEIVVTGFESDWEHFFSLRSPKAGAQGAHPDIAKLADELYEKLNSVNK